MKKKEKKKKKKRREDYNCITVLKESNSIKVGSLKLMSWHAVHEEQSMYNIPYLISLG